MASFARDSPVGYFLPFVLVRILLFVDFCIKLYC